MVTHGESKTKLNKVWRNMKDRCYNKNNKRYPHYGGRGIYVCDEWIEYVEFRDWAIQNGYEDGLSLDRIDNDGPYAPWNCRWTTSYTQNNNFSRNRKIKYCGVIHSISEWSRILGIHRNTLDHRLSAGWSIEEAFFTKTDTANRSPAIRRHNFTDAIQISDAFQVCDDEVSGGDFICAN